MTPQNYKKKRCKTRGFLTEPLEAKMAHVDAFKASLLKHYVGPCYRVGHVGPGGSHAELCREQGAATSRAILGDLGGMLGPRWSHLRFFDFELLRCG